jgi:hypothetical protein
MAITEKQGIEKHDDCTMVIIPRYHKNRPKLVPGLYCENHGCLIQWLTTHDYKELKKMGVEDLGPIKGEAEQAQKNRYLERGNWI